MREVHNARRRRSRCRSRATATKTSRPGRIAANTTSEANIVAASSSTLCSTSARWSATAYAPILRRWRAPRPVTGIPAATAGYSTSAPATITSAGFAPSRAESSRPAVRLKPQGTRARPSCRPAIPRRWHPTSPATRGMWTFLAAPSPSSRRSVATRPPPMAECALAHRPGQRLSMCGRLWPHRDATGERTVFEGCRSAPRSHR